jgi:hypothetical protein
MNSTSRLRTLINSRTKIKSPQTNGICERLHKTVFNELYRVAFRKEVYRSIDELQNEQTRDAGGSARPRCRPYLDAIATAKEKIIAA